MILIKNFSRQHIHISNIRNKVWKAQSKFCVNCGFVGARSGGARLSIISLFTLEECSNTNITVSCMCEFSVHDSCQ